ncbi:MAG TPA: PilX N-terminal domain-containing pilus assembly protein [Polyangiaceae bacterium]|nr:PilX N-terminal domain-containing pilus assembly protein [Polyangiaceae bacterium]
MKPRADERGAALFVVVLVVTLLTAIGVFAMHATSLAQLSSGYSRRAGTAFYLAELAANLRLATIADDVNGYTQNVTAGTNCLASKALNPLVATNSADWCIVMTRDDAVRLAQKDYPGLAADPEGFFGALNRPDSPLDQAIAASIRVESTDHRPPNKALAGQQLGGPARVTLDTLTVNASLSPNALPGSECTATVTRASETQWLRGYVSYVQL